MLLRRLLLLSPLLFTVNSSYIQTDDEPSHSWSSLSALLDSIDDSVLHGVLHQLAPKFQDGVFSQDRSAIEHVHSEDPIIASKLVHIALKRQAANGTTTPNSPSTVAGETTVLVSPDAPASATAVATVDGGVVFSTIGGGLVTLQSSAVEVSISRSTSQRVFLTTLPDGEVQTQTSVVVVDAPVTATDEAGGTAGAAATTGSPGLQDTATGLSVGGVWLGLVGGAGLVLLL